MSTENKNETPAGGTKPASKQRGPRRAPRAPKAAPKAVAPQAVLSLPNPNTNGAPAAPKPARGRNSRQKKASATPVRLTFLGGLN